MARSPVITDLRAALLERRFPTVTVWNRLEGRPRTVEFDAALRAEVRDPLWMLARQWQLGEFRGEDAGSPVSATYHLRTTKPTRYRGQEFAAAELPEGQPLEAADQDGHHDGRDSGGDDDDPHDGAPSGHRDHVHRTCVTAAAVTRHVNRRQTKRREPCTAPRLRDGARSENLQDRGEQPGHAGLHPGGILLIVRRRRVDQVVQQPTGIPRTSAAGAPAPSPKLDRPIDEGGYQNDHAYDQQVGQAIGDDADDTQNDRHNDQ
jgi:hypothetical protein